MRMSCSYTTTLSTGTSTEVCSIFELHCRVYSPLYLLKILLHATSKRQEVSYLVESRAELNRHRRATRHGKVVDEKGGRCVTADVSPESDSRCSAKRICCIGLSYSEPVSYYTTLDTHSLPSTCFAKKRKRPSGLIRPSLLLRNYP